MNQFVSLITKPKKSLQRTLIFFTAIVFDIFLFILIAVTIGQAKGLLVLSLNKYNATLNWVMAALSFICLFTARQVFNRGIVAAKNSLNPLNDKLKQRSSALVRYLVICEVSALVSILLFMLAGNFMFRVFAGILFGFMMAMVPVRRRVVAEPELNGQHQRELE
jgi:hypothetical protein